MFKSEEIYRELQKDVRGLKKSTHKHIVACQGQKVRPLGGMTSDRPAPARVRKAEPLPTNVKAIWRF